MERSRSDLSDEHAGVQHEKSEYAVPEAYLPHPPEGQTNLPYSGLPLRQSLTFDDWIYTKEFSDAMVGPELSPKDNKSS